MNILVVCTQLYKFLWICMQIVVVFGFLTDKPNIFEWDLEELTTQKKSCACNVCMNMTKAATVEKCHTKSHGT